jgi:hypothetical protein
MTYGSNGIEELRRQRQGVCHRCGWTNVVGVVRRTDRRRLRTGHQFGRLCYECVVDLARTHPVNQPTHEVAAGKSRQVA